MSRKKEVPKLDKEAAKAAGSMKDDEKVTDFFLNLDKGSKSARVIANPSSVSSSSMFESNQIFTRPPKTSNVTAHCVAGPSRFKYAASCKAGRGLFDSRAAGPSTSTGVATGIIRPKVIQLPFKVKPVVHPVQGDTVEYPDDDDHQHRGRQLSGDSGHNSSIENWEDGQYEPEEGELDSDEETMDNYSEDLGRRINIESDLESESLESGSDIDEGEYIMEEGELDSDEENISVCEAGTTSAYSGGHNVDEYGDFSNNNGQSDDEDVNMYITEEEGGFENYCYEYDQSDDGIESMSISEEEHEAIYSSSSSSCDEEEEDCDEGNNGPAIGHNWFQINLETGFGKTQMGVVENGVLWSCSLKPEEYIGQGQLEKKQHHHRHHQQQGMSVGNGLLQFYVLTGSTDLQLQVIDSLVIMGTGIRRAKVVDHVFENKRYKSLVMLTNCNELLAFDIGHRRVENFVRLEISDPDAGTFFHDMAILEERGEILLLEKRPDGNMHSITVFQYPPCWEVVNVFTFDDNLRFGLRIDTSLCLALERSNELTVLSWSKFIADANSVTPIDRRQINSSITISNEWQIVKIPKPENDQRVYSVTPNARLLLFKPSLILLDTWGGKEFHELATVLETPAESGPIYDLVVGNGQLGDGYTKTIPFPDHSSRILNTHRMYQEYEVVSFEKHLNGAISSRVTFPFNEYAATTYYSSHRESKMILAMAFNESLNLLCVLFSHKDKFNVNFYDPRDLTLVYAFPLVKRVTSKKYRSELIKNVFMSFETTLLFVLFTFDLTGLDVDDEDDEVETFYEAYCCILIAEDDTTAI